MTLRVYTSPSCPYCVQAKRYLKEGGVEFEELNIANNAEAGEFLRRHGHRSVPQIYIDDHLFVPGGYQGLSNLTYDEINEKIEQHQENINQINQLGSL